MASAASRIANAALGLCAGCLLGAGSPAASPDSTENAPPDTLPAAVIQLDQRVAKPHRTIPIKRPDKPELAEPHYIHFDIRYQPRAAQDSQYAITLPPRRPGSDLRLPPVPPPRSDSVNALTRGGLIQQITLDKSVYKQGEIATLNVTAVLPLVTPQVRFLGRDYPLYATAAAAYQTILAVPMDQRPGSYALTLTYEENGNRQTLKMPFQILAGDFKETDTLELDIHVLTEETLEMLKYEGRYFSRAYHKNYDSRLTDGPFIWPCAGKITELFGTARKYNKELDKWSHKAIDISSAVGTPVLAANRGIVVMTEDLDAHGKSVVIAHGQGIHTVYIHLHKILVAKGDTVVKGQKIATMGKTGMCTGPNLHFQIMVRGIATDPRCWLEGGETIKKGQWVTTSGPRE